MTSQIRDEMIRQTRDALRLQNEIEIKDSKIYRIEPHNEKNNNETLCMKKEGEHLAIIFENRVQMTLIDFLPDKLNIPEIENIYFVEKLLRKHIKH